MLKMSKKGEWMVRLTISITFRVAGSGDNDETQDNDPSVSMPIHPYGQILESRRRSCLVRSWEHSWEHPLFQPASVSVAANSCLRFVCLRILSPLSCDLPPGDKFQKVQLRSAASATVSDESTFALPM